MSFEISFFPTLALCGRITARTAAIFMEHGVQMVNKHLSNQGVHRDLVCGVIDAQIWSHSVFSTDFSVFGSESWGRLCMDCSHFYSGQSSWAERAQAQTAGP